MVLYIKKVNLRKDKDHNGFKVPGRKQNGQAFQSTSILPPTGSMDVRFQFFFFFSSWERWSDWPKLDQERLCPMTVFQNNRKKSFVTGDRDLLLEEVDQKDEQIKTAESMAGIWSLALLRLQEELVLTHSRALSRPLPASQSAGHMAYYVCTCFIFLSLLTDLLGLLICSKMADSASKCLPLNNPRSLHLNSNFPEEKPWLF